MSTIIGIDPGISGAIAVIDASPSGVWITDVTTMPTIKVGSASRVNAPALAEWLQEHDYADMCWIEKVGAMPGQGVSSMFSFGHAAGMVEGIASALRIPVTLVTPQAWKKSAGLIGKDKDAARSRAVQLFPRNAGMFEQKGRGQAIADALLIAWHGATRA